MKNDVYDKIVDAATRVVNRVGFAKATVEAIAEEAGLSKGGVLHYFKNKDDCLLAILERIFARILADTYEYRKELPDGPGQLLKAYIMAWIKWQQPPNHVQIKGLLDNDILRERLIDLRIEHYNLVVDNEVPLIVVQKALLVCAGLWTTPLLARATLDEMAAFFEQIKLELLRLIDDALSHKAV